MPFEAAPTSRVFKTKSYNFWKDTRYLANNNWSQNIFQKNFICIFSGHNNRFCVKFNKIGAAAFMPALSPHNDKTYRQHLLTNILGSGYTDIYAENSTSNLFP